MAIQRFTREGCARKSGLDSGPDRVFDKIEKGVRTPIARDRASGGWCQIKAPAFSIVQLAGQRVSNGNDETAAGEVR